MKTPIYKQGMNQTLSKTILVYFNLEETVGKQLSVNNISYA
jgi:hypothetical protein